MIHGPPSEKIDESAFVIISLEDSDAFCCVVMQLQFRILPIENICLRRNLISCGSFGFLARFN